MVENFRLGGVQVRHHPEDAGEAGGGRRLRAPGAPLGAGVGAAVRRPASQAHAHRHDEAAGAEPYPAHHGEDRAGARRPGRTRRGRPWSNPSSSSTSSRRWTAPAHSRRASRRPIPRKLGLDGTRKAIEDVRASLKQLDAAKQRLANLERQVKGGAGSLTAGLQSLDEARKKDYAFARSLLQLPTFSAPEIGEAFFGKVSIDRFQQALYYTELARRYMPPGLLPKRGSRAPSGSAPPGSTSDFPRSTTGRSSWSSSARWTSRSAATARCAAHTRRSCRG